MDKVCQFACFLCLACQHVTQYETQSVQSYHFLISSFIEGRSFSSLTVSSYLIFKTWPKKLEIKNLPFRCPAVQLSTPKRNV